MRLAVYNVENLFDRAAVMNQATWALGRPILEKFAALNQLLGESEYTEAMKNRMVELLDGLNLSKSDSNKWVILRHNRGKLLKRSGGQVEITANGRSDWAGMLELVQEPVDEEAMRNTARVVSGIGADILAIVEAEDRTSLLSFNEKIVKAVGGTPYQHVMLIDGNDSRGIDVGIMAKAGFPLDNMCSHVDDIDSKGSRIFSRDCAMYKFRRGRNTLWVLVNHLKSKGFGSKQQSDARRKGQAQRVSEIYHALRKQGVKHIAVVGDLNDTPDSDALSPLIQGTNLQDVATLADFDDGGYPGTYGSSGRGNKIDYILLSPELFARAQRGGIYRKGMWPGVRPRKWEVFPELKSEQDAASDHGAVWVDLAI